MAEAVDAVVGGLLCLGVVTAALLLITAVEGVWQRWERRRERRRWQQWLAREGSPEPPPNWSKGSASSGRTDHDSVLDDSRE